ncbi:MAG: TolB family protein [Pseudomonadales bacterium]
MNAVVADHIGMVRKYVVATLGDQLFKSFAFCIAAVIGQSVCGPAVSLELDDIPREIVSLRDDGTQIEYPARSPSLGQQGLRIAFVSADPLIATDSNLLEDVYVRDRKLETSILVSYGKEEPADRPSYEPSISLDGDHVAYTSLATNLVCSGCDANARFDVYLFNFATKSNHRISQALTGETDGRSHQPSISRDGNRVAFTSLATNLIANDTNGKSDVFVWDRYKGISRVSFSTQGDQLPHNSHSPRISGDGRHVVFVTEAGFGNSHVLVRDLATGTTLRVSEESNLTQVGRNKEPSISEHGDMVAWVSNGYLGRGEKAYYRVFVRQMVTNTHCLPIPACFVTNPYTFILNDEPGEQREPQIYGSAGGWGPGLSNAAPAYGVVYTSTSDEGRRDVVLQNNAVFTTEDYILTISGGAYGEDANGDSQHPTAWGADNAIGWVVSFETNATNLIVDDNNVSDIVFAEYQ